MFGTGKKERTTDERVDTLIGERTRLEGNLHTSDTTHINGILTGDVVSDGMLIIGASGKVVGNIISREILVAGQVQGNLKISEKLIISESGVITGDIETKALIISEGAVFTGSSKMTSGSPNHGAANSESRSSSKNTEDEKSNVNSVMVGGVT